MNPTWIELLRTRRYPLSEHPTERLHDVAALGRWLAERGLEPAAPPGERDLLHARELREELRNLAHSIIRTEKPDAAGVAALNRWLAVSPGRLRASAGEPPGISLSQPADTGQALGRIARAAAEDIGGPTAAQLSMCEADDCGGVFIDPSGRRRWCSSATCGNRARVRAHRSKKRTTA